MISIAMATYNGEKYIREQLDSIFTQTYTDWELIICDDCSKDATVKILHEYAGRDKRIKVYENEENLGYKKNFEKAIGLCTGEYIALSDQDDVWYTNHLRLLLDNIGECSLSCGNADLVDTKNKEAGKKLNEFDNLLLLPDNYNKFIYRILFSGTPFCGMAMLLKASFIKRVLPIPTAATSHDVWFALCACFENGIAYTFDCITRYRQHSANVSGNNMRLKKISKLYRIKRKIKTGFKTVCLRQALYTDRFAYTEELIKRYGKENTDFQGICTIYDHLKIKKLSIKDIVFLWKNYSYITTMPAHKGFLSFIIILLNLKPFPAVGQAVCLENTFGKPKTPVNVSAGK